MSIFSRKPEDTLAQAKLALSRAVVKFEDAAIHALNENGKTQEAIQALTEVISERQARANELRSVASEARSRRDTLATLT